MKRVEGQKSKYRKDYLVRNITNIFKHEGWRALFKGLPVTLVGVIPARYIYFYSYHKMKSYLDQNTPAVHMISVS